MALLIDNVTKYGTDPILLEKDALESRSYITLL